MAPGSRAVPAGAAELTTEWFRTVLAGPASARAFAVTRVERVGEAYGFASVLLRCRFDERSMPSSVIVKLWATDGPAGSREVPFYASFGRDAGIRVPRCHHGALDQANGRGVLVLEDLSGARQGDCLESLEPGRAARLADDLAAMHARWWAHPDLIAASWLPAPAERVVAWLDAQRELFLQRFGGQADAVILRLLESAETLQARASERLAVAEATLVHGDLHLDNLLFEDPGGRPVLLDWSGVMKGPAVIDLAELLFAIAPVTEIEPLLARYQLGLRRHGIADLQDEALRQQLGGALLRMLLRVTCGVARWWPESERGRRMIPLALQRVARAIDAWQRVDPELFRA